MSKIYSKLFILFFLIFSFNKKSFSQDKAYPGTPSSSYNFNYSIPSDVLKKKEKRQLSTKKDFLKKDEELTIVVKGNLRLDRSVIIRDSKIEDFPKTDQKALSKAVKNLYLTGFFNDVKIFESENIIYINVKENPIINKIAFEGNSEITDEALNDEILSKVRKVYSKDKIKSDVIKIQNLYKRLGFFSSYIEPKIIKIAQNRVNLVFEVYEGLEAKIKKINFIGNKEFSDSTLKDVLYSEETRWYKFWGSGDKFDQDRLDYDKDLLKKYYYDNGYIDFRILSTTSQLVATDKNFIINFKISEGKRYKLSEIKLETSIKDFELFDIDSLLVIENGDWFSSKKVDRSIDNIIEKASELGFAFVDVRPKLKKVSEKNVNLTFVVYEGSKIFIDRINIRGNLKTADKVIRREIELMEGDAFNLTKIKKSERNIKSLALFESVNVNYEQVPKTNKTSVDVEITEKSTGEFSVGAGFSSLDGALGNLGVKESNLFGEGKELALQLGISTRKSSIDLKYTEPYFLEKDIAAGIDLFNTRANNKTYSGYKHNVIGFKVRAGYEIFDDFRHFSSYTLKRDKIHDIDTSSSTFIKAQEGKSVTSMIGQAFQYDKLNDRLNPTDGYRIKLDIDYYGLGGNAKHLLTEFKVANFTRLFEGIIAANFLELGYILPVKDVRINDRFFLSGDDLRGFKNHGMGPRDTSTTDALGGEQYFAIRNELHFPIGLPEELGVKGLLFGDAGSLHYTSNSGTNVKDDLNIRASVGFGISWLSPFGPVKFFLSRPIIKESFDKNEIFRFSFGTTY